MRNTLFTVATVLFGCVSIGKASAADFDVWGLADMSIDVADDGEDTEPLVSSNGSRFGVTVTEQLTPDIEGFAQLETGIALDGEGDDPFLISRNSGVGMKTPWGTVIAGGKWNEPLKITTGPLDPLINRNGNADSVLPDRLRAENQLLYKSPSFSGLQFLASYAPDEDAEIDSDITNVAAIYRKKPVYLAGAYRHQDNRFGPEADSDVYLVGGGYSLDNPWGEMKLALVLQHGETDAGPQNVGRKLDAVYANVVQTVGKNDYIFAVGELTNDVNDQKQRLIVVNWDYHLTPRFKTYVSYTRLELDDADLGPILRFNVGGHGERLSDSGFAAGSDNASAVSVGVRYRF